MKLKVILSEPTKKWSEIATQAILEAGHEVEHTINGKDVQLKVYKGKYYVLVIDSDTQNNSAFDVIRYVRFNSPAMKIILTVPNKDYFKEMDFDPDDISRLGVGDVLTKPYSKEDLIKSIDGQVQFKFWKQEILNKEGVIKEEDVRASDDEFTRIKASEFYSGNATIFDLYIRLNPNHYIKILKQGDFFNTERLNKYQTEKNVEYFYFKTRDRSIYINFINTVLSKVINNSKVTIQTKVSMVQNATTKFIEEIYTQGLQPQLIDEGKTVCENVYKVIRRDKALYKVLRNFEEFDPTTYSHSFLVVFFASVLCSHLAWASKNTTDMIVMGGMLHDIGKLKLKKDILQLNPDDMTDSQFEEYKMHPEFGVEMVSQFQVTTEQIKQIILQHHEHMDGLGFPRGLTGIKTYPLAKVISLVDKIANDMVKNKLKPVDALKEFLSDRIALQKYEPEYIKAFMKCFINPDIEV